MFFGICPLMSCMPKFWHTYVITCSDFMVTVEPCEPRFNGVFSRGNLPRIKGVVYLINLDVKKSKGIHLIYSTRSIKQN